MPPNFDYTVRVSVGECNDDGTRTATFTLTTYSGTDTYYEIDFDTSVASTDATGTIAAGSGLSVTETYDYPASATYGYEVRFFNAATGLPIITAVGSVSVDACCDIQVTTEVGDCNSDGTREVTIVIENDGTSDEDVTIDYGDGSASEIYTISAGGTKIKNHDYPASAEATYTLVVTTDDCGDIETDILIEPCGTCPSVAPVVEIGECENDMRTVTVTLTVTPSTSTQVVAASLSVGSDSVSGSGLAGETLVLVAEDSGAAGSTMEYTYEVTSPSECDTGSVTTTVDLPECSETRVCPNIDIDFKERDCAEDGTRKVKTKAIIVGNRFQTIEAELIVNGFVVDTDSGMGTLTLADTDIYTPSDSISATVHIITPEDCPSYTKATTVSSCGDDGSDDDDEDEEETTTGDTCATNPLCCWMCWLMMFFSSSVFFLLAASGAGLWYPYALIIAAVAALLWTPFLIWAYNTSCDDCFISACIVRGILLALLVTIVLVILSLVGISIGATTMQLLLMALALAASFSAAYAIYQSGCGYLSLWTW